MDLYGVTVAEGRDEQRLKDRIRYSLAHHGFGDYARVPLGGGLTFVVSDVEIGAPVERDFLQSVMLDSRSEWGSITTSKGWRADPDPVPIEKKTVDLGICTSTIGFIRAQIAREYAKIPTTEQEYASIYHICDRPEVGQRIDQIAGVMSDTEFWGQIRSAGYGRRGRDEIGDFIERLIAR